MKILIIGGAGFVGKHLTSLMISKGCDITVVDKREELEVSNEIGHLFGKIRFKRADASKESEICDLMNGMDMVFHLAASSDVRTPDENDTVGTTKAIVSSMSKANVKRLLYTSTSAVYGVKECSCKESDDPDPISDYGKHKATSEAIIRKASEDGKINGTIVRFANVVGPGQTHGVILDFVRKLNSDNKRLEILGDGMQTKEYVHIHDVISAIDKVLSVQTEGIDTYNISSGSQISVREIADIVCEIMDLTDVDYKFGVTKFGWPGDVPRFSLDISKLESIGWRARYDSEEAVRDATECILKEISSLR